jgi:hypothetical protein
LTALIVGISSYLAGSFADVYTTKRALLDAPLGLHEANRLMAPVIRRWGWQGIAATKLLALAVILGGAWRFGALDVAAYALIGVGVLFLSVAWRNRRLIVKARRR